MLAAFIAAAALAGCSTKTVYVDRIIEVKVPVTVPCKQGEPDPITMLRETMAREEWEALTTDQRANLLAAQSLAWRTFGWQATDAAAGCLSSKERN
jgi:hypothetical protein